VQGKNRIFRYPVLRKGSQDYIDDSIFEFDGIVEIIGEPVKDIVECKYKITLRNQMLSDLIESNLASIFASIYCSATLFKALIPLGQLNGEFTLPAGSVIGSLEVIPMIISTEDIEQFSPGGVNPEYGTAHFFIDAGSQLALGEKFSYPINPVRRNFQDLIRVQTNDKLDANEYGINLESNVITINMGINARLAFDQLRSDPSTRPHLYMSFYKDAVVQALSDILKGDSEEDYAWNQKLHEKFADNRMPLSEESSFSDINAAVLRVLGPTGLERMIRNVE
jgi:hypothetical protein